MLIEWISYIDLNYYETVLKKAYDVGVFILIRFALPSHFVQYAAYKIHLC